MAEYIHYSEWEKSRARQTDIANLLRRQGETLKKSSLELVWREGSDKVTIRGNLWFHQYDQEGGDAIDFVRRFYNKTYPEAMEYLLGGDFGGRLAISSERNLQSRGEKVLTLPPQNDNMRRVYAYLVKQRKVDSSVLDHFVRAGSIYEDAKYHNVVFLGRDESGVVRHVHKRGSGTESTYKGNETGSVPEYSFHHIGSSDKLYAFEAPIDMLSYISLHKTGWKQYSYVALCSVADRAIFHALKQHPNLREVVLCLDNDEPGQQAVRRIAAKLTEAGYRCTVDVPHEKDWNEDLKNLEEEDPEEEPQWEIQLA